MADRDFLERIDRHMARGNEVLEEVREEMRLSREERADLREFTREIVLRVERVSREQVAALGKLGVAVEAVTKALDAVRDELHDMRQETGAQTRAIVRVLDRLDGGAADASA